MPTAFRTLCVLLVCCALTACGPKPRRVETVASRAATGEMVARSWLQGAGVAMQAAQISLSERSRREAGG
ncbi:MAG TPA: hypothetical protein VFI96_00335 [Longimicrobiaceae bacterium]|nr:hypothetical protein [Longimicrobiaceae bacterium]